MFIFFVILLFTLFRFVISALFLFRGVLLINNIFLRLYLSEIPLCLLLQNVSTYYLWVFFLLFLFARLSSLPWDIMPICEHIKSRDYNSKPGCNRWHYNVCTTTTTVCSGDYLSIKYLHFKLIKCNSTIKWGEIFIKTLTT